MLVKCTVRDSFVESQKYVDIKTCEGVIEQVPVSTASLQDGGVEVWQVGADPETGRLLVELPNESVRGSWRIWIPKSAVLVPA
jgi:hypothetical protein